MTTAQVVETSDTVNKSSFQNYAHPNDHTSQTAVCIVVYADFGHDFAE